MHRVVCCRASVLVQSAKSEKEDRVTDRTVEVCNEDVSRFSPYLRETKLSIVAGKVEHLKGNIEALSLELSDEEIVDIDSATDFQIGFPMGFLFESNYNTRMTSSDIGLLKFAGKLDSMPVELRSQAAWATRGVKGSE
jgi:hypothetical protein